MTQSLLLLNNLTQYNQKNRQVIMQLNTPISENSDLKQPAIKALVEFYEKCEETAKYVNQTNFSACIDINLFSFLVWRKEIQTIFWMDLIKMRKSNRKKKFRKLLLNVSFHISSFQEYL